MTPDKFKIVGIEEDAADIDPADESPSEALYAVNMMLGNTSLDQLSLLGSGEEIEQDELEMLMMLGSLKKMKRVVQPNESQSPQRGA